MNIPSQRKYDEIHALNVEKYSQKVKRAYNRLITQVSEITYNLSLNPNDEFYFRNNPEVSKKVNRLIKGLYTDVYGTTVKGINSEWGLAVDKNNQLAIYAAGESLAELPDEYKKKWFTNNDGARNNFIKRKDNGLSLSEKVWKNTEQVKYELELALDVGIGKGKSAASLSKDIRSYLNEPDKLFRKVRSNQAAINDKLAELKLLKQNDASLSSIRKIESDITKLKAKGVLRLSKAAKAYSPGQGRYRSSYKNSLRLTANETNFSYEGSQLEKRKQQDFIVAIDIKVSPSHNASDDKGGISCINLQGRYPKDFNFTYKWHVNCKCMSLNVLKTKEEINNDVSRILSGGEPIDSSKSKNAVNEKPNNYTVYLKENTEKYAKWKNPPRTFDNN